MLLLSTFLYAIDSDIDGVDDAIDRCLNTSFDDLVDEYGCPFSSNPTQKAKLSLEIGTQIAYDQNATRTSSLSFYAAYSYQNWFIALSNRSFSIDESSYDDLSLKGDYYLMGGYSHRVKEVMLQYTLGLKIPNQTSDISTQAFDYFAFLSLSYPLDSKLLLHSSYGYTYTGETTSQSFNNYHSFALGGSYQINPKWNLSLEYHYSGSSYNQHYHTLGLNSCYSFNDRLFVKMAYERGLNDDAYLNSFSFSLGVNFE
jgi:predicted porin